MSDGTRRDAKTGREARESEYNMSDIKLPWWMIDTTELIGAEDPPEGGAGGDGGEGGDDGQEGNEGGDEGGDEGAKKEKVPEDTAGLKSALEKERRENAKKDRELKRLQKAEQDRADAEKSDVQKAQEEAERAKTRSERLAAGFKNEKLDNAIRAAAATLKFHDPDDALLAVDRDAISWEQDDDDPSKVTIDKKTVDAAVKRVATTKPHLVKSGTDDGGPTGGQFGGGNKGTKKEADEAALHSKYPAL